MATRETASGGAPTYVFRLLKFDENGSRQAKRKYGYAAKHASSDVDVLDETVFDGIVTRAEQAFNLTKGSYSIFLLLPAKKGDGPGSPSKHELGLADIKLGADEATPVDIKKYAVFSLHTRSMKNLVADKKNRKVVNLCVVDKRYKLPSLTAIAAPERQLDSAKAAPATVSANLPDVKAQSISPVQANDGQRSSAAAAITAASLSIQRDIRKAAAQMLVVSAPNNDQGVPAARSKAEALVAEALASKQNASPRATAPQTSEEHVKHMRDATIRTLTERYEKLVWAASQADHSDPAIAASIRQTAAEILQEKHTKLAEYSRNLSPPSGGASAKSEQSSSTHAARSASQIYRPVASHASSGNYAPFHFGNASIAAQFAHRRAKPAVNSFQGPRAAQQVPGESARPARAADPTSAEARQVPVAAPVRLSPHSNVARASPQSSAPPRPPKPPMSASCSAPHKPVVSSPGVAKTTPFDVKKYEGLRRTMDKFVLDMNASMADIFGIDLTPHDPDAAVSKPAPIEKDVLEGTGEKESLAGGAKKCKVSEAESAKEEPVKHRATCDLCNGWIVGLRYKCLNCPDWDCCESCFNRVEEAHPGHSYAVVRRQGDVIYSKNSNVGAGQVKHVGIHCDSCNKPISGIRYKCTHPDCPDFDLCADCEADPVSYAVSRKIGAHDCASHYLLKVRTPLSPYPTSVNGAARQLLNSALQQAKRFVAVESKAEKKVGAEKDSEEDIKTFYVDVDVPYEFLNGKKEITIPFDLGRNEKGETIIIGPSKAPDAAAKIDEPVKPVQMETERKEVESLPAASDESLSRVTGKAADKMQPPSTEPRDVSESPIQEKTQVEEESTGAKAFVGNVAEVQQHKDPLNASWLADVTFEDGATVSPGTVFNKIWRVTNSGTSPWPAGSSLVCVSGFGKTSSSAEAPRFEIPQAAVGQVVEVVAKDIVAPEIVGKFMSYYRFVGPDGQRFGDRLWIDVNVEEYAYGAASKAGSSDISLNNSSVITPTISVKMDGVPSQSSAAGISSAITSPRSIQSDLPEVEFLSSNGTSGGRHDEDDDFVLLTDEEDEHFAEIESVGSSRRG